MTNLHMASKELFRRSPDERYPSLQELWEFCHRQKENSTDLWKSPKEVQIDDQLSLCLGTDGAFALNDWSFSQLCRLAGVAKDTVNRLSRETASRVFHETLPGGSKPMQVLVSDEMVRSIHGTQYTRLWNVDLVTMLREFATDFEPPQKGINGATGLYAGEQDIFLFLIDPAGWCEIDGEAFAPGLFLWNSEVGRRSLGIQTFWFQQACANHIVWDATEIVEWTRKHTARVHEGLPEIRRIIEALVEKRDARRDGFVATVRKAMREKLGDTSEEALKVLNRQGITRKLAKAALEVAQQKGSFTIWSLIDALTRLSQEANAGDRTELDSKSASLLQLVEA